MHSFFDSLFFLTLLVNLVVAIPTPVYERRGRSFTVHRKRNVNYVPNGTRSLLKAYRKFGIPLPEAFANSSTLANGGNGGNGGSGGNGAQRGQVDATPEQNDAEYLSPVVIGGQTMMMNFDSGS